MTWLWIGMAIVAVFGAVWLLMDYLRGRVMGFEDRYMGLYGKEDWEASGMEFRVMFDPTQDPKVKDVFSERLTQRLLEGSTESMLLTEEPVVSEEGISFTQVPETRLEDLGGDRKGVRVKLQEPGKISILWNHMQADGVGLWRALRPLFDPNPQILNFDDNKRPLPLIPEMLAFPTVLKSVGYRSQLQVDKKAPLQKGFRMWSTQPIKELKDTLGGSFNLLSTAMLLAELFHRHPEKQKLTVGLTVAFTFLKSKNQYGVYTLQIERGSFEDIYRQVQKQVKGPAVIWGSFSCQSYLLGRCSDEIFMKVVNFFRGQIDVLISNLPVGKADVEIGGVPAQIAVYPKELTLPYYFLLLGTRSQIHLSFTSKFDQDEYFLDQARLLSMIESYQAQAMPAVMAIPSAVSPTFSTSVSAPVVAAPTFNVLPTADPLLGEPSLQEEG
ncbi:MAG: hypothetical protein H6727_20085 [Myxococcales bacterium]|nr:hypothetical protein [Myxococcales bacterium]